MVSSSRPSPSQSRRGDEPLFSKGKTKYKPGWEEDERVAFCAHTLDGSSAVTHAKATRRARGTRKLIDEFYQTRRGRHGNRGEGRRMWKQWGGVRLVGKEKR